MNKNSLIRSISSLLDLFPSERDDIIQIPSHSDAEAMKKDLEQVGKDMSFVLSSHPSPDKDKSHKKIHKS